MSVSSQLFRWSGSFVVSVAAHVGAVAMTLDWAASRQARDADNPAAVMLELAPLAVAPEPVSIEAPPGPDLSEVIPEPEPPPPVEIPPMPLATMPSYEAPVVPQRKIEPIERKPERRPPVQRSAPPVSRQAAAESAAPAADPTPRPDSAALPSWKSLLVRHLERHKRYPAEAQRARHEGVAYIRFVTGRDGKVSSLRVERTAGFASLDQEGLDLLMRSQPLPPLPSDQPGDSLEIVVPVQFFLKR